MRIAGEISVARHWIERQTDPIRVSLDREADVFSKVVRKIHMYLALFLTPWVLMYGLSTAAMNHRDFLKDLYDSSAPKYESISSLTYDGKFTDGADSRLVAEQILDDLGMAGSHRVRGKLESGRIQIFRDDPVSPKRITYRPESGELVVEREVFRAPSFLERMHRRRGYGKGFLVDDSWAVSVDLVIFAMIFWVLSGLWLWWELKVTRKYGLACLTGGLAVFGMFLFTI